MTNGLDGENDEGTKKLARHLADFVGSSGGTVLDVGRASPLLVRKLLLGRSLLKEIKRSAARVILYLPTQSATRGSFVRSGVLRRLTGRRVVLVAAQPRELRAGAVWRRVRPDALLSCSPAVVAASRAIDLPAEFIPTGVDTTSFRPAEGDERARARSMLGLPLEGKVLLHVGHLSPLRNLDWLARLASRGDATVAMVASSSTPVDPSTREHLERAGVKVIRRFLSSVGDAYRAADCYLFPVQAPGGAIGLPLSVLEAMATNIPVVTTRFGALDSLFAAGDGLAYADGWDAFAAAVARALLLEPSDIRTRSKIAGYDWRLVAPAILSKIPEGWAAS